MSEQERGTLAVRGRTLAIRQFEVTVVEGPDRGLRAVSQGHELTIGTSPANGLVLTDRAVSRHHCALRAAERGLELRDLDSTNGTRYGDCEIHRALLRGAARIRLGATTVAIELLESELEEPLSGEPRLGDLIGASPLMRRLYPLIERCAETTATVLVEGEPGSGKELVAESIHRASPRRRGPFVVVDCAALPRGLIESELFGHVRGAFIGADTDRAGAFVAAAGGTLMLDEVGELPLELQPVLLRALESRTVRPAGSSRSLPVDARIIAATSRELRVEVNHKRLRADLFHHLRALRLELPPLRERAGDIALLSVHFWRTYRPDAPPPPELVADLAAQPWPGNVRELRSAVERAALGMPAPGVAARRTPRPSYGQAKAQALLDWERGWVEQLLAAHRGNLARAARAAKMGRGHLRELARRHRAGGAAAGTADPDE